MLIPSIYWCSLILYICLINFKYKNKMRKKPKTHPSYGMVSFSRVHSSGDNFFFGSHIPHNDYIELKITPGEVSTESGRDWFYNKGIPYIVVNLTNIQFSELITSMNMYEGVPCTIKTIAGKNIEKDEEIRLIKQIVLDEYNSVQNEFLQWIADKTEIVKRIIDKKSLSKSDKETILALYNNVNSHLKRNLPFYEKSFIERLDRGILEAKADIEQAILHKVTKKGFESFQNELQNGFIDKKLKK